MVDAGAVGQEMSIFLQHDRDQFHVLVPRDRRDYSRSLSPKENGRSPREVDNARSRSRSPRADSRSPSGSRSRSYRYFTFCAPLPLKFLLLVFAFPN